MALRALSPSPFSSSLSFKPHKVSPSSSFGEASTCRELALPGLQTPSRAVTSCRAAGPPSFPRPFGNRPSGGNKANKGKPQQGVQEEGPPMNSSIKAPTLRLLGEDNSLLGIVSREDALLQAQQAGMDLVLIAPDAEPPVARIMNYGKFRYEQQKKKRDQQRKVAANRQETKELKMRYNIDIGDYNVRLKQAKKFLKEGDKVKVSAQFRGREMEFKELGIQLFQRFATDVAELGVVETQAQMEGKTMQMVLIPSKAVLAKAPASRKKKESREKKEGLPRAGGAGGLTSESEGEFSDETLSDGDFITDDAESGVGTEEESDEDFTDEDDDGLNPDMENVAGGSGEEIVGTFQRSSEEQAASPPSLTRA